MTRHPRGNATGRMSALLLGEKPSRDLCAGYPVHRVFVWNRLDNGVMEYRADCGYEGYTTTRFGNPYRALPGELCDGCWT